jgi:UDP-N-acetylglucosamine 4,6-dehydratase (inverting)
MTHLDGQTVLITGGTGSFGRAFVKDVLTHYPAVKKIIIFSRDEQKHFEMMNEYPRAQFPSLQFMLGDVRDRQRVMEASYGVDIIVHSAAMKHVPTSEMNPMECVKTNILGSQNIVDAALENGVKKVVALSSDKASGPANFYGASKLCLERLFTWADGQKGNRDTRFTVVRYANVFGSKGSVVPFFLKKKAEGYLPVTHPDMTRLSITMQEGVDLVHFALREGWGGEVVLPLSPSYRILDIAKAVAPTAEIRIVGIRPGEKIHETMFTDADAPFTVQRDQYYIICPNPATGSWTRDEYCKKTGAVPVPDGFVYSSDTNKQWLSIDEIRELIRKEINS